MLMQFHTSPVHTVRLEVAECVMTGSVTNTGTVCKCSL